MYLFLKPYSVFLVNLIFIMSHKRFYLFIYLFEVELIYSVVLISALQQGDSAVHMYNRKRFVFSVTNIGPGEQSRVSIDSRKCSAPSEGPQPHPQGEHTLPETPREDH